MNQFLLTIRKCYNSLITLLIKLFALLSFCVLIRVFVFEIYYIPSSSMEKTLKTGDYVFVSKIHYGPRLPRNIIEIPIVNIFASFFYSNEKIKKFIESEKTYRRLSLSSNLSLNKYDVVVFNTPNYQYDFSIKRCVKIPSDTLFNFNNSKVRISGNTFINADSLGHIKIPWKGYSISKRLITHNEKNDNNLSNKYTFNHDYFYFLGDNSNNSIDSRYWGLVQDDHIVGKAICILFSKDKENNKIRWSRVFKFL